MADTRALYVISVAAELAGVHPQTLRIYERKGLLAPARTSGRSRRYSDHDIQLLRRIQELTNEGHLARRACSGSWRSSRSSTPRASARPGSKRASTRCSRRWKSASPPRTSSTGARSSRCAAARSCSHATTSRANRRGSQPWHSIPTSSPARPRRRSAPRRPPAATPGNTEIAPEHLLRALLDQPEGVVNGVLERIGVDLGAVRRRVDDAARASCRR